MGQRDLAHRHYVAAAELEVGRPEWRAEVASTLARVQGPDRLALEKCRLTRTAPRPAAIPQQPAAQAAKRATENSYWALTASHSARRAGLEIHQSPSAPRWAQFARAAEPTRSFWSQAASVASWQFVALAAQPWLTNIRGEGASFPAPLYHLWCERYNELETSFRVEYVSSGSGKGIEEFTNEAVDFGATDAPMTEDELAAVDPGRGALHLPVTAGSLVLAYNLEDAPPLKLSRDTYVNIFLGKITSWADPAIKADNPTTRLPDTKITVVRRSDGSGTTFVFTSHLKAISADWPEAGKSIEWPVGEPANRNEGVAEKVKATLGAIGYMELAHAKKNALPYAALQNKSGRCVLPEPASTQAALASVDLNADLLPRDPVTLADPPGENAYPIVSYTWILAYRNYTKPESAAGVRAFFTWAVADGQALAESKGYVPLPTKVAEAIRQKLAQIEPKSESTRGGDEGSKTVELEQEIARLKAELARASRASGEPSAELPHSSGERHAGGVPPRAVEALQREVGEMRRMMEDLRVELRVLRETVNGQGAGPRGGELDLLRLEVERMRLELLKTELERARSEANAPPAARKSGWLEGVIPGASRSKVEQSTPSSKSAIAPREEPGPSPYQSRPRPNQTNEYLPTPPATTQAAVHFEQSSEAWPVDALDAAPAETWFAPIVWAPCGH